MQIFVQTITGEIITFVKTITGEIITLEPVLKLSKKNLKLLGSSGPRLQEQSLRNKGKPTLVLDLDNTLITSVSSNQYYDFQLFVEKRPYFYKKRPGLDHSLLYELVIFSSGCKSFVQPKIEQLDVQKSYISYVLDRSSTIGADMVKDLNNFGRDLKRLIWLDDEGRTFFCNNLENGITVPRFSDQSNEDDTLLADLEPFLKVLPNYADFRLAIRLWKNSPKIMNGVIIKELDSGVRLPIQKPQDEGKPTLILRLDMNFYQKSFIKDMAQSYEIVAFSTKRNGKEVFLSQFYKEKQHIACFLTHEELPKQWNDERGYVAIMDLTSPRFGRDLKRTVWLDNFDEGPVTFCRNIDNGLFVFGYHQWTPVLKALPCLHDFRPALAFARQMNGMVPNVKRDNNGTFKFVAPV